MWATRRIIIIIIIIRETERERMLKRQHELLQHLRHCWLQGKLVQEELGWGVQVQGILADSGADGVKGQKGRVHGQMLLTITAIKYNYHHRLLVMAPLGCPCVLHASVLHKRRIQRRRRSDKIYYTCQKKALASFYL
jgi:hypothetical protein